MKEIGSEFWTSEKDFSTEKIFPNNARFFLSGRSALVHIIKDILGSQKKFHKVGLPSYLCHTMIQPFLQNGIECKYYDIKLIDNDLTVIFDESIFECDAILVIEYFGYHTRNINDLIDRAKKDNIILIEDITHQIMKYNISKLRTTYAFASYRKWTGVYSGAVVLKESKFAIEDSFVFDEKYEQLREHAMNLKKHYIEDMSKSDKNYLDLFRNAEEYLEQNYIDYSLSGKRIEDLKHLNYQKIVLLRNQNAKFLHNELSKLDKLHLLNFDESSTPLFVPIFVEPSFRNFLKDELKKRRIYCPVHWLYSKIHIIPNSLYDEELSLVCDQRYNNNDLIKIVEIVKECHNKFYEIQNI